jgi:hypothetical protein
LFGSDLFKIMNAFWLGFGNGLLGTFLMIIGPQRVDKHDSEKAGFIMAFYLTLGRSFGSAISGMSLH